MWENARKRKNKKRKKRKKKEKELLTYLIKFQRRSANWGVFKCCCAVDPGENGGLATSILASACLTFVDTIKTKSTGVHSLLNKLSKGRLQEKGLLGRVDLRQALHQKPSCPPNVACLPPSHSTSVGQRGTPRLPDAHLSAEEKKWISPESWGLNLAKVWAQSERANKSSITVEENVVFLDFGLSFLLSYFNSEIDPSTVRTDELARCGVAPEEVRIRPDVPAPLQPPDPAQRRYRDGLLETRKQLLQVQLAHDFFHNFQVVVLVPAYRGYDEWIIELHNLSENYDHASRNERQRENKEESTTLKVRGYKISSWIFVKTSSNEFSFMISFHTW